MVQFLKIADYVLDSFIQLWPYLLITIPLAVAVQLSGAAKFISASLSKKPVVAILLATAIGAFSPFCSCGVIPVIASLLIGGVPLAPVMSFWIASPSMDPEIFFLSTATIGWNLSVWRLAATFVISLLSGFIIHFAIKKGILGNNILREKQTNNDFKPLKLFSSAIVKMFKRIFTFEIPTKEITAQLITIDKSKNNSNIDCCVQVEEPVNQTKSLLEQPEKECKSCETLIAHELPFHKKLWKETWKASFMVAKFMTLAFFINALINFYVPQDFISGFLSGNGSFSVAIAALIGIPVYTSNITALPLISGLLSLGMNQGAALAFLIAGPTTTLPAMVAVWGIVQRKIFFLYISFSLFGAILFGLLFNFTN